LEVDEDGLRFDAETVEAERISEDADYEGVRVTLLAYLERDRWVTGCLLARIWTANNCTGQKRR
jgi:hypothetical protein